jgi:hypothetical protein
MNNKIIYKINDQEKEFSIVNSPLFQFGNDEILSNQYTDVSFGEPWHENGYSVFNFSNNDEFISLKNGLTNCVKDIIRKLMPTVDLTSFCLENYHKFVKTNEDHLKVVAKTRDLFSSDFDFDIENYLPKLEKFLNFKLTDIDPFNGSRVHIIIRINRPNSKDYNPPHKDIYEGFDNDNYIPQFINFWIPIAGVTEKSSLPIVPNSHKINEKNICRTLEGGLIEGQKYRVRMIRTWGGENNLLRSEVGYGQVLVFSSHLIHGLAINEEADITRTALEFRLFKKNN